MFFTSCLPKYGWKSWTVAQCGNRSVLQLGVAVSWYTTVGDNGKEAEMGTR